ncbi:MAG: PQQ-binding-like beta-propeller repeat protein [Planctomycetota bacterium]|nr:PQQ-binding-like beta-propeller repeat protein [Planctomycetota bacterium]
MTPNLRILWGSAVCLLLSTSILWSQEETKKTPAKVGEKALKSPRAPLIRSLIKKLGLADWEARESARRRLIAIGDEALPHLALYFKDEDRERAFRAREIHNAIRWRVPEILSKLIGPLIDDYTTLTKKEKLKLISEFSKARTVDIKAGASFLAKMIQYDADLEIKEKTTALYLKVSNPALPQSDPKVLTSLKKLSDATWNNYAQAILERRMDKVDDALVNAKKAHQSQPTNLTISNLYIDLLIQNKDHSSALPLLEALTKSHSLSASNWTRYGECLVAVGQKEKGLNALKKVLKIPGADKKAKTFVDLSGVFLRLGFGKEALDICRQGLLKYPYDRGLNVTLAESEWSLGQKRNAFRRLISEMRYSTPGTLLAKRIRLGLKKAFEEAGCLNFVNQSEFWRDLERGRPVAKAHDRLARWLEDRGLDSVVLPELKLVSLMWSNDIAVRLRLGASYERLGMKEEAREVYQVGLSIDPKNSQLKTALTALEKSGGAKNSVKTFSGLSFWEKNFEHGVSPIKTVPRIEGPFDPPALFGDDMVIMARPDVALLTRYHRDNGKVAWNTALPAPPAGQLVAGEVGVETLGLVKVPAALAMTSNPERAFTGKPLLAVVLGAWERDSQGKQAGRWNRAFFRGLWVLLLETKTGKKVGLYPLKNSRAPRSKLIFDKTRFVYRSQRGETRHRLSLMDMAAGDEIKFWAFKGRKLRALRDLGSSFMVSQKKGRFLYGKDFEKKGQAIETLEGRNYPIDGFPLHVLSGEGLYSVKADGRLGKKLDKVPSGFNAGLAIDKDLLMLGKREGTVAAYDLKTKTELWTQKIDRGAERHFHFAGPVVFAINGLGDSFPNEVPYVVGLDRKTGALVWKRPYEVPASFAFSKDIALIVSGGSRAIKQGKILVMKIGGPKKMEASRNLAVELKSAALDAYQGQEYEVSNLLFRLFQEALGKTALSLDEQIWQARILARSNRPMEAENVLAEAEELVKPADPKRFHKIRKDIGLETEDWPDEETERKDEDNKPKDPGKKPDAKDKNTDQKAGEKEKPKNPVKIPEERKKPN